MGLLLDFVQDFSVPDRPLLEMAISSRDIMIYALVIISMLILSLVLIIDAFDFIPESVRIVIVVVGILICLKRFQPELYADVCECFNFRRRHDTREELDPFAGQARDANGVLILETWES